MAALVKGLKLEAVDGRGLRVGVISTQWNDSIVGSLQSAAVDTLKQNGVDEADIVHCLVPGAYELPFAAKSLILSHPDIAAVICLGAVIRGGTPHFEYICEFVSAAIGAVGLETGVPVIFGVLTVLNEEQAKERSGLSNAGHNHGVDYGLAAIRMAKYKYATATTTATATAKKARERARL